MFLDQEGISIARSKLLHLTQQIINFTKRIIQILPSIPQRWVLGPCNKQADKSIFVLRHETVGCTALRTLEVWGHPALV